MLVDSHCHLDRVDLSPFENGFDGLLEDVRGNGVAHMLCVSINLEDYPAMVERVAGQGDISISVGVHPNEDEGHDPSIDELVRLAQHPANVAIGETGLDYFRSNGDLTWQRDRFRRHIAAAKLAVKPLIIHTREAREDTIAILQEEDARDAGGVMHCFAEDWETARRAMDLNFYISFSGIVTFKNATELKEVARQVPLDRMLIETDSPYLAPVPKRGKPNQPAYVRFVAEHIAELRGESVQTIAQATTDNFYRLFSAAKRTDSNA